MNKLKGVLFAGIAIIGLAACNTKKGATATEAKASNDQLTIYNDGQPVPVFKSSQLRQNLIEIETAQAHTTATTSFMFNQGIQDPIASCPSIGFPIPADYQLTNPQKVYNGNLTLPQIEQNGVYTGATTGTYVICVDGNGKDFAHYWEGFVSTVTGPATWDVAKHQIVLTGDPTAAFTGGK